MAMGADRNRIIGNSIEDELRIRTGQAVEALLDDVVAVEVLNHGYDMVLESVNDRLDLIQVSKIGRKLQ